MKPVAIVGASPLVTNVPYEDTGIEIWEFNNRALKSPRTDALFQMHQPAGYEVFGKEYLDYLSALSVPVYMREVRPEFPASVAYPFDEILAMTAHVKQGRFELKDLEFLTSSPAEAIALAIFQNRPRIGVYGIEFVDFREYIHQAECILFWLGFAAGRGITLEIHCSDHIFRHPIYGE
jgi:hypothetical protein